MREDILRDIWPEWQVEGRIGKGSYGTVYRAVRQDHNLTSYAAIKVISVPRDPSEINALLTEGRTMAGVRAHLEGIVHNCLNEIQLMQSFKGTSNIVGIDDYKVVPKTDSEGWEIYIRMELLTPLAGCLKGGILTESEVIKIGVDICSALELCSQRRIIHRDIKPENIFVNEFGYYKLGDFGIARQLENLDAGLTRTGTLNYMAPEVVYGNYDERADIYSLGLTLYYLLNGNCLPFLNPQYTQNGLQSSFERRLHGESLPAPQYASAQLADAVLRACSHSVDGRYSSAYEMKQALLSVAAGTYVIPAAPVIGETDVLPSYDPRDYQGYPPQQPGYDSGYGESGGVVYGETPKKKKTGLIIGIVLAVAVVVVLALMLLLGGGSDRKKDNDETKPDTHQVSPGSEGNVTLTIQPADVQAGIGQNAVFSVEATGEGLTYQWQYRKTSADQWENAVVDGNDTAQITVPCTIGRDGYQYSCLITDKDGNEIRSDVATLTVLGPRITTQPRNITAMVDENAVFQIEATGDNLSYQWQYRKNADGKWEKATADGNQTAKITVPGTVSRNGYQYRCVVTDGNGVVVASNEATLTVVSVLITAQPEDVTVAQGGSAVFRITAEGKNLTYQWQFRAPTNAVWTNSTSEGWATAKLTIAGTADRTGYQYRCVIRDADGKEYTSNTVTLTVVVPQITVQPTDLTVNTGSNAVFKITAIGEGLSYQWQYRKTTVDVWQNATADGNDTARMTVPGTIGRNGYQYRCVITDQNGNTMISDTVNLTVVENSASSLSIGTVSGSSYENRFFGFGYSLNNGWSFATDAELSVANGITGSLSKADLDKLMETNGLVQIMTATDGTENFIINVIKISDGQSYTEYELLEEVQANVSASLEEAGLELVMSEILTAPFAGEQNRPVFRYTLRVPGSDLQMYGVQYVFIQGDYVATVTITTLSLESLDLISNNFYAV